MFKNRKRRKENALVNEFALQGLNVKKGNSAIELHEAISVFMQSAGFTTAEFPDLLKKVGITTPVEFGRILFDKYRFKFIEENGKVNYIHLIPATGTDKAGIKMSSEQGCHQEFANYKVLKVNDTVCVEKMQFLI